MFKYIMLGCIPFIAVAAPLGLPPVPIPLDNPQTAEKIALGDKLYHDKRFSADGKVSCATCHEESKAFTDNLSVSKGFRDLTGTRNAPTVINSAYMKTLFWDGREPDLEGQSIQPPINPVEGGLPDHTPILKTIQSDPEYGNAFKSVFNVAPGDVTMEHVSKSIASFERTIISGNSPFDQYQYGGNNEALTTTQIRGLDLFRNKGRCVSCHRIEETQALFIDNRFHNIGIGFKKIQGKENSTAQGFLKQKRAETNKSSKDFVDIAVLTNAEVSELGRFAVTENPTHVGAFKTSTLRNIELTAPYMHDGSLQELEDVVDFYNNGGRVNETDPLSNFLAGGIRPLNLSDVEKADLVNFLKALTSPEIAKMAKQ